MEEEFIIWSVKLNAWWGQTSTYTSDFDKAKRFSRDKAVAFCKARFNGQITDGLNCVPVPVSIMQEIGAK